MVENGIAKQSMKHKQKGRQPNEKIAKVKIVQATNIRIKTIVYSGRTFTNMYKT